MHVIFTEVDNVVVQYPYSQEIHFEVFRGRGPCTHMYAMFETVDKCQIYRSTNDKMSKMAMIDESE